MKKIWETLTAIFKKYFIAGALVLVPIIATIWVLKSIALWADSFIIALIPSGLKPEKFLEGTIPGIGIVVTIALTLLTGVLTRLYFGKQIVKLGDRIISKIPIGRGVYNIVKQFLSEILTQDKKRFRGVCLVEWPREGMYMLAFITGDPLPQVHNIKPGPWMSLFIPTTPNPTSGFFVMLPQEKVVPLDISVDHAFKLIISGGIVTQTNGH
jgi:uncharacterized membrane protein